MDRETYEFCLVEVKKGNVLNLGHIPKIYRTSEIKEAYDEAMKRRREEKAKAKDKDAYSYPDLFSIPKRKLTQEVVEYFIKKGAIGEDYSSHWNRYLNDELSFMLLEKGVPLDNLPHKFLLDTSFVKKAFDIDLKSFYTFPVSLLTKEIISIALDKGARLGRPEFTEFLDQELSIKALNNGSAPDIIPKEYLNQELIIEALKNGAPLYNVPESFRCPKVCEVAMEVDPENVSYIPEKYLTLEWIIKAIEVDGYLIRYVPKKFLTYEVFEKACKTNPYALQYLPDNLASLKLYVNSYKIVIEQLKEEYNLTTFDFDFHEKCICDAAYCDMYEEHTISEEIGSVLNSFVENIPNAFRKEVIKRSLEDLN